MDGISYGQSQADSFFISESGYHDLVLVAKNNYSQCADTSVIKVKVNPEPVLNISPDATICIEDSYQILVSGAADYQWTPSQYLSSDTVNNPISVPIDDITYYVNGVDTNGCESNDSITISVQQRPELTWITPDTSIFIGADFQINTSANTPLIYSWSPSRAMGCSDCPNPWVQPKDTTVYAVSYTHLTLPTIYSV